MRLAEAKIKEAILHPDRLVRQEAVYYFSNCFSRDTAVMPLAIQAIEKYGRRQAFQRIHDLADLAQTEATIEWAMRELNREGDLEDRDSYFPALSRLLCNADPQLLVPRAQEILQAPGFTKDLAFGFQERLDLLGWDADRCWKELEATCQEAAKAEGGEFDSGHADRVVEALVRQGDNYTEKILELLAQKVTDFENDPMVWLEEILVDLAGEMRLERAIPLIVAKLHDTGGDILPEKCVDALGKIGTDAAAEAIAEGWLAADWDYRLYATSALEKVHADATVQKCLELLPQDKDRDIRTKLADALLAQLDPVGIEPVRETVQNRAFDGSLLDLPRRLVAVSMILGVDFPELPIWKREAEEQQARFERRMRELWAPARAVPKPPRGDIQERKPVPFMRGEKKKVGRNGPCPCGSGKKFKKCCMNKA